MVDITLFTQIIYRLDRSKINKLVSIGEIEKYNKGYTT
jgi:hypothetical protein